VYPRKNWSNQNSDEWHAGSIGFLLSYQRIKWEQASCVVFITLYTCGCARAQRYRIWYLYTYEQALPRYFGSLAESVVPFAKLSCRGRLLRPCHSQFSRSTLRKRPRDVRTFRPSPFSTYRLYQSPKFPSHRRYFVFVPTPVVPETIRQ